MHIAVAAPSLTGRLHSTFELVLRLKNEGHKITYLSDATTGKKIKAQGFDFIEIPPINFNFDDPDNQQKRWLDKFIFHLTHLDSHYVRGKHLMHLEEYQRIISNLKPDRILVDVELHDLIFASIASKTPTTLYHTWFSDTASFNLPPIRSSIIPKIGFNGSKIGIALARVKNQLMIYGRFILQRLTFNDYRRTTIRKYAKEIGFSRLDMCLSTLPPLYRFKKLPILSFAMTEMEFPHKPTKNLRYIGPMVYADRVDIKSDENTNQRLLRIFDSKKKSNKKLIYCSVSSFSKGDTTFLKNVVQAVREQEEWMLILALGGNLKIEAIGDIPENAHVFNWVPQLKVLEVADCSINHAGINSINECIHFKVPMLVYSGKNFDQNGNAARVAYHGIGIRGDKDVDDSIIIRKNIKKIVTDSSYVSKITEIHKIYKEYCRLELTSFL